METLISGRQGTLVYQHRHHLSLVPGTFSIPALTQTLKILIVHAHSYKSTSICHIEGKENLNNSTLE